MTTSGKSTDKSKMEKRNNLFFLEHLPGIDAPLNWHAEWEHLTLELSDLKLHVSEAVAERAFGRSDRPRLSLADGATPHNTKSLSDEEVRIRQLWIETLNTEFVAATHDTSYFVTGRFATERRSSIGFLVDGDSPIHSFGDCTGRVFVRATAKPEAGDLSVATSEDAKFDPEDEAGVTRIEISVPASQMERFVRELRDCRGDSVVRAHLYALAFRSEMDRSLSEPTQRRTLYFERDGFSPVMLGSLTISCVARPAQAKAGEDGDDAQGVEAVEALAPESRQIARPADSGNALKLKQASRALWVIAALLFLILLRI